MAGRRQILGLMWGNIWDYQLLPVDWDDAAYDDIIAQVRLRRSLDLLGGSPDLGGDEGRAAIIGPPYYIGRWREEEKRQRDHEAAELCLQVAREKADEAVRREQWLQEREEAWSRVRRDPVPSGDTFRCPRCGATEEILLPPPSWPGHGSEMSTGAFLFWCAGCGEAIGITSKRLTRECDELRPIILRYGWHPDYGPRSLPPRVQPYYHYVRR